MILSALKKNNGSSGASLKVSDIDSLLPFESLHEKMLGTILANCELIKLPVGSWCPTLEEDAAYFLRSGELSFSKDKQTTHILNTKTSAAKFPLPIEGWAIRASAETEVIKLPVRYLELNQNDRHLETETLQFSEGDVSGEVYLEFYESLKGGNYDLPSMPDLAVKIGKAIDDDETLTEDIARLIQMDPALATRIMSVVNSAAFGAIEPITSIKHAVTRMGRQQVRNLVFSCIIKGLFRTNSPVIKKRMDELWLHSSKVAAISFVLAKVTPGMDPNRALLAGLLHDIGGIPILQAASTHPEIANNADMLDKVVSSLQSEVGALTLEEWGFGDDFICLAKNAEHWLRVGSALPDCLDAVLLAQLHAFIGTKHQQSCPIIDQVPAFKKMALGKLTPNHSIGVLERAKKDIEEVTQLLRVG